MVVSESEYYCEYCPAEFEGKNCDKSKILCLLSTNLHGYSRYVKLQVVASMLRSAANLNLIKSM